jgi:hypothetical protein
MRRGGCDELAETLVRLLLVDQEQNGVGDDPRKRNEVGAAGLHRTAE